MRFSNACPPLFAHTPPLLSPFPWTLGSISPMNTLPLCALMASLAWSCLLMAQEIVAGPLHLLGRASDDFDCDGATRFKAPSIDRPGSGWVRLTDAYASAAAGQPLG